MTDILLLCLLGIGIGGFYGILATGIVVGHKGSGLINLDQGALAMYPAYTFVTMRESGDMYFPWFDFIPGPIDIPYKLSLSAEGVGTVTAFIAAMLMSLLLGIAVQTLIFGPLRNKPAISKIIGSLGALVYLTSLASYQFGSKSKSIDGILPEGTWQNPLGLNGGIEYSRILLAAIAIVIGGGLALYYRKSKMGLCTRAIEDSETGGTLLGYSVNKIATVNWLISTTITGLAGILALDFVSLTPTRYTLFLVPALGAALFGNLTSPWLATSGGILLGIFQSGAAGFTLKEWWPEWIPSEGLRQAIPLLVIVVIQFTRGHKLPVRGSRFADRQPKAPIPKNWKRYCLGIVLFVFWVLMTGSSVTQGRLITSSIAAILMLSSVIVIGYLGQLSLANLTFAGVAAYLSCRFAADGSVYGFSPFPLEGPGFPSPLAMTLGVMIAIGVGILIAIPAVRIRGLQLAVVTLAGAVAITELIMGNESLIGKGARSNLSVPPPEWFGVDITVDPSISRDRPTLIIFCCFWLLFSIFAVAGLRKGMTGRKFHQLFGQPPRESESDLTQFHMDLAASIQVVTEEITVALAKSIKEETGAKNLCLAGGVALNCVSNGKLLKESIFDDIWIQPAAGDAGTALGAALLTFYQHCGNHRSTSGDDSMKGTYLGPSFSNTSIQDYLKKINAPYEYKEDNDLFLELAQLLKEGKVVGWFNGPMEFGPRALGARSIIGDPRNLEMQSVMNLKIKYRESFRPFAPSVLEEDVSTQFDLSSKSPYMLLVAPIKEELRLEMTEEQRKLFGIEKLNIPRSTIPAITHVDYSARVQTVSERTNPRYYNLIKAFKQETGCPTLINTSFNVRGEPIVCSPQDAYRCFMRTEMDVLVLENQILLKAEQPKVEKDEAWMQDFELD